MAFVQAVQGSDDAGISVIDVTLTGVVNGNYLVAYGVCLSDTGSGAFTTQSGSTGAWTQVVDQLEADDFGVIGAAYAVASATGDVTVRFDSPASNNNFVSIIVVEIDNIDSYDSANYSRQTGSPAVSTATTPSAYDAMVVGFTYDWGLSTTVPTATTNWTFRNRGMDYPDQAGTPDGPGVSETRLYTSGNVNASFDTTGEGPFFTVHLAFNETAGGPAAGVSLLTLLGTG